MKTVQNLEELTIEQLFKKRYNAYEYLSNCPKVNSYTQDLIKKISCNDINMLTNCFIKTLEELKEVEDAVVYRHIHENQTHRETVINEIQQFLYWPTIICIGQRVPYEKINFAKFIKIGMSRQKIIKNELVDNLETTNNKESIILLRRCLYLAGYNLGEFNKQKENKKIEPSDILIYDLMQMLEKEYFIDFFKNNI